MSGSPMLDVNQRGVLTPERGGDKALVSQLLLSYDILIISRMDHHYERLKLPNEWEVWYWCVGLERTSTRGVWCWMSPRASRHPGGWCWKEEFLSPASTVPLVARGSELRTCGVPRDRVFPGTFPLKCIAFSHPFWLIFSLTCSKGRDFSSSFWFGVVIEFKQVLP